MILSLAIGVAVVTLGYVLAFREKRYAFVNPVTLTRVSLRLGRNWRRKPGESAQIMFEGLHDGSLIQITPFPREVSGNVIHNLDRVLQGLMNEALKTSVETALEPQLYEGRTASIAYVVSTDSKVRAGEWRFKASGVVCSGEMTASITILSHIAPPLGLAAALRAVSTIRMSPE